MVCVLALALLRCSAALLLPAPPLTPSCDSKNNINIEEHGLIVILEHPSETFTVISIITFVDYQNTTQVNHNYNFKSNTPGFYFLNLGKWQAERDRIMVD